MEKVASWVDHENLITVDGLPDLQSLEVDLDADDRANGEIRQACEIIQRERLLKSKRGAQVLSKELLVLGVWKQPYDSLVVQGCQLLVVPKASPCVENGIKNVVRGEAAQSFSQERAHNRRPNEESVDELC
jgi:hypothetical protein